MKTILVTLCFLAVLLVPLIRAAEPESTGDWIDLLASRDLDDWDHYFGNASAKKERTWSFTEEGVLVCTGRPIGYLATKKEYKNFILVVEWRWPTEADDKWPNSGVQFRISGEPMVIPNGFEAQLRPRDAGAIYSLQGKEMNGDGMIQRTNRQGNIVRIIPRKLDAQNPKGEWNKYVITVIDDEIVVEMNGQEVNRATGADATPGQVALQSEGGLIEFRTVKINSLD